VLGGKYVVEKKNGQIGGDPVGFYAVACLRFWFCD
jgi:hypothetical protein